MELRSKRIPFFDSNAFLLLAFIAGSALFLSGMLVLNALSVLGGILGAIRFIYDRVGWVVVPLAITTGFLVRLSIRNIRYRMRGEKLSLEDNRQLGRIESIATELGLLGTASGIVVAMTNDYIGMSEVAAQAAKMAAFGTALYTTIIGLVISLIAKLQATDDS